MKKMFFLSVLLMVLGLSTISSAFEVSVGTPAKDGGYHSGEFHSVQMQTQPAKEGKQVAVVKAEQQTQSQTANQ